MSRQPPISRLLPYTTLFRSRPFFVEGSGTFRFNMDCNDGNCTGMFYSRRIGRAPQGAPELATDEYSQQPDSATIIGAGRSEEHTSELQSQSNIVCRLLLEKK